MRFRIKKKCINCAECSCQEKEEKKVCRKVGKKNTNRLYEIRKNG